MNRWFRAAYCVPCGAVKMAWTKLFHGKDFKGPILCLVSPLTEITLDPTAKLIIGKNFKMRDGAKIRVRKGAIRTIGNNTSISTNNIITCHERIEIGDNVQLSPNVLIYDHDHDFRYIGKDSEKSGLVAMKFKTTPIKIGNNVWVGANTVILRGTDIGDNCVIGAGCVVKGKIPKNTVLVQKRVSELTKFEGND